MRCFVAIDIDDTIRAGLSDLQKRLAGQLDVRKGDVKWVSPEAIHLTLKFLGETRDEQIVEVCRIVADVAGRHKGFDLDVESVGCFGGRSARVLWVGAGLDCDALLQLQEDIERQLEQVGWPREQRKFSAHLTLCRIRNARAGVKIAKLAGQYKDFSLGAMSADSVSVYRSELTPKGPIYTVLGDYKLL